MPYPNRTFFTLFATAMRSTPHHDQDPAADAPLAGAADDLAAKATDAADAASQKLGATADAATQKLDATAQQLGATADAATKKLGATADAATQKVDEAVAQGKDWLQNLDLQDIIDQIPQSVRDLGAQLADRVRRLSPTQQVVGGAALAFTIGLLATHNSRKARHADAKAGKKYRAKYD